MVKEQLLILEELKVSMIKLDYMFIGIDRKRGTRRACCSQKLFKFVEEMKPVLAENNHI